MTRLALILGLITTISACGSPNGVGPGQRLIVTTSNYAFAPESTTVAVGTTVTWNVTTGTHTVTFTDAAPSGGSSDSLTGPTQFVRTFDTPGIYDYFCEFHVEAGMFGEIVVQ